MVLKPRERPTRNGEGDEDLEVTSIKVALKGHRNSRSQRLDQATFGGAHRVINDI
ncbi:hypothetical protein CK203_044617 [Vitis vinifera]|uniref:Uncharacterized protein n=1 Tax=Vitis vinifera TaxID=29760 RepID=A0A438HJN6_VITVI|nr:hypothetical protein CK203_044617 [Vitis vinifera]